MKNILLVLFVVGFTFIGNVEAGSRSLVINVQSVPLAWGDSNLEKLVYTKFSYNPDFKIVSQSGFDKLTVPFPSTRIDTDSLLDWGTEIGGRYLLVVTIDKEYLKKKKSFSLPLFFHKYETKAVISGEFRYFDIQKRRLLGAEPFKVELSGARQFQMEMDDNSNDPSLHLSAPAKTRLFLALEEKLTRLLVKKVTKLSKGRR